MTRLLFGFLALLVATPLFAQQANQTELRLVIVDQTGAGIPAAVVVVTPQAGGAPITFESDERGIATSPAIPTGAVTVVVEFPGFEPFEAPLTLRRGAMNETVTLRVAGFEEEVAVSDSSASETLRASASTTTLSQEEIDALPDDPDELAEALAQMAGPGGATIFMNGFSGGRLPNRDQIRMIRFRQNSFAADNHDAGRTQIDIFTRPNTDWRGNANINFGGDAFNARQPQAKVETPEQERQVQFGVRGPLVASRTSFSFNANGRNNYLTNPIIAIDADGNRLAESARSTSDQSGFSLGLEHSLTQNQSLYLQFQRNENENLNQGVGGFNLPERASNRTSQSNQFRARLQGIVGGSMLNEIRLEVNRSSNEAWSQSGAPTIVVQDAFTSGGAGVNSRGTTDSFELAQNFDFTVRGGHQMRVGFLFQGEQFSNFDERNKAGTFTFASLEAYRAGRPLQFTRRDGTLDTSFSQYQLGFYWQDEFRVHRTLSLGVGVRNESQSRIDDRLNLMPRIGFTWAPFGSQTTAVRGGYGLFHDWYESNLYDQTLRVDGVRQRDLLIMNPGWPDPFAADADTRILPSGRVQAHPDLRLPRVHQASVSVDRQLVANLMLQVSYQRLRGENQMRSRNINAPVDGVRPFPGVGNITQFESTGRSESDRLQIGTQLRLPSRQMFVRVNYTLGQEKNFADGATALPSDSLNPDVDWGPARQDIRHRIQVNGQVPVLLGIRTSINFNAQSGVPYNMTTGRDDNFDGVINDRPQGVGRNSLRGDWTWGLNLNVSRRFAIGVPRTPATPANAAQGGALFAQRGGGGGFGGPGGGGRGGGRGPGGDNSRYSVELFANANNVLNHVTHTGYSGNLLSPYFGRPTNVGRARDVNVGLRFNF